MRGNHMMIESNTDIRDNRKTGDVDRLVEKA